MKILLITDQHFGVRNDNQHFINHYKKFYNNIVIPFIKASGIKQIICLGDTFDRRRAINFMSLNEAKEMWFDPLRDMGIPMTMLVGNHDIYYKNTLRVNAPNELLRGMTTSISLMTALPLILTVFLFFFCLGYVTTTESDSSRLFRN